MARELVGLVSSLDESGALSSVEQSLANGVDPQVILGEAREAMVIVGQRFSDGEYFIPELVYSGEILKSIVKKLEPHLKSKETSDKTPQVILGTVSGDIHDIGKNLVKFILEVSGFGVVDLGVDVPPQRFVDAVRETGVGVVALSGFLTLAFQSMKDTVEALGAAGLRDRVRVMVGGGQIDAQITRHIGADAYGKNAMDAVKLAKGWLGA